MAANIRPVNGGFMEPLKPILEYHPEIHVDKNGERFLLKMSVPDWKPDAAVLKEVGQSLNAKTVGEIIEKAQISPQKAQPVGKVRVDEVIKISDRIEPYVKGNEKVWNWNEEIPH